MTRFIPNLNEIISTLEILGKNLIMGGVILILIGFGIPILNTIVIMFFAVLGNVMLNQNNYE